MLNAFYDFLSRMGYHHPVHPTEVHMPIGLVVGAFVFALVLIVLRRRNLVLTPRHCIILAFIWIFPTILFGIMDWQHFYGGAWVQPIKVKMVTAPTLTVLLALSIFLGRKFGAASPKVLPVYFLCVLCVVVLGYYGGQLTLGNRTVSGPAEYKPGENIYSVYCTTCHPSGGNTIDPSKPLLHSPLLQNLEIFKIWIRHPGKPMPAFASTEISDKQAEALYAYIQNVLNKP